LESNNITTSVFNVIPNFDNNDVLVKVFRLNITPNFDNNDVLVKVFRLNITPNFDNNDVLVKVFRLNITPNFDNNSILLTVFRILDAKEENNSVILYHKTNTIIIIYSPEFYGLAEKMKNYIQSLGYPVLIMSEEEYLKNNIKDIDKAFYLGIFDDTRKFMINETMLKNLMFSNVTYITLPRGLEKNYVLAKSPKIVKKHDYLTNKLDNISEDMSGTNKYDICYVLGTNNICALGEYSEGNIHYVFGDFENFNTDVIQNRILKNMINYYFSSGQYMLLLFRYIDYENQKIIPLRNKKIEIYDKSGNLVFEGNTTNSGVLYVQIPEGYYDIKIYLDNNTVKWKRDTYIKRRR